MPNKNKLKGTGFEYDWMYYMIYHHFESFRSYASIGVADVRHVPPIYSVNPVACYAQCKNTKKGDYIAPWERKRLWECQQKYHCLVIEPYKKDRTCFVKIRPWSLKGYSMKPEDFLTKFYGIEADSWSLWRKNWFRNNIKRKP